MVSVLSHRKTLGFNIDSLLGTQHVPEIGDGIFGESESAFTSTTSAKEAMDRNFNRDSLLSTVNSQTAAGQRVDLDFCSSCCDNSPTHDGLLNGVRSYEMSNSNLTSRNFMRSGLATSHPWSLIDTVPRATQGPHSDLHRPSLGNFGFKLHNSFVQLDNISSGYSPFSSLYTPVNVSGPAQVPSRGDPGASFSWPTSRGGGYLSTRCTVNPDSSLFMPYRKPKRVRTAFSPTQLLRLEHAFEKNHYVVGQERKEIASSLNLSETQVKVWFQNRRTKHKRMQAEEEMTSSLAQRLQGDEEDSPSFDDI